LAKILSVLFLCLVLVACAGSGRWHYPPEHSGDKVEFYVVSHGWHTGLVVQKKMLNQRLRHVTSQVGDAPYYEFGWGDREYYRAPKATLGLTLRAALLPTRSVMHVVAVNKQPKKYFTDAQVIKVSLSNKAHKLMVTEISQSVKLDTKGNPVRLGKGLYGKSRFFEAKGRFILGRNCNNWTARMLKKAGVPIQPLSAITTKGVMSQTRKALARQPGMNKQ
jgi:uncharacterized protein (TIGR02117 family)